jgi:hypothetical protein
VHSHRREPGRINVTHMAAKSEKADIANLVAFKLGVKQRRVYQLAKELAERASVTTAEAIWVLAAQNRINLTKYLPPEVVDRVRNLLLQMPAPQRPASTSSRGARRKAAAPGKSSPKEFVVAREFKGSDPILPVQILTQAREMAAIYPLLYVLENSMREFVRLVIDAKLGATWWTIAAPTKIRAKILSRIADDHRNAWHQRRGSHPVDYLDLNELPLVVHNNELLFVPDLLPSSRWFEQFVEEVYKSRCVVCHMNPLESDNVLDVRLKLRKWQKHVDDKKSKLPEVKAHPPKAAGAGVAGLP